MQDLEQCTPAAARAISLLVPAELLGSGSFLLHATLWHGVGIQLFAGWGISFSPFEELRSAPRLFHVLKYTETHIWAQK